MKPCSKIKFSMIEIIKDKNNRFFLRRGETIIVNRTFFNISWIEGGNWLMIKEEERDSTFFLVHENDFKYTKFFLSKRFSNYRSFSVESKTFIAHSEGKDYLFYNNGSRYCFSWIGDEYNGYRPIMKKGNIWNFLYVMDQTLYFDTFNGFTKKFYLNDGDKLYQVFGNCFTIKRDDGFLSISYIKKYGSIYKAYQLRTRNYNLRFNEVYCIGKYIIGHLHSSYYIYHNSSKAGL